MYKVPLLIQVRISSSTYIPDLAIVSYELWPSFGVIMCTNYASYFIY